MQKKSSEPPTITTTELHPAIARLQAAVGTIAPLPRCATREHIESIDKPGHCVWCDAPMRDLTPLRDDEIRAALIDIFKPEQPADPVLVADAFHELTRSLTPELAIVLKAIAYGAKLFVVTGTFGYRAALRSGGRLAEVQDLQLSKCIIDLAATWERS